MNATSLFGLLAWFDITSVNSENMLLRFTQRKSLQEQLEWLIPLPSPNTFKFIFHIKTTFKCTELHTHSWNFFFKIHELFSEKWKCSFCIILAVNKHETDENITFLAGYEAATNWTNSSFTRWHITSPAAGLWNEKASQPEWTMNNPLGNEQKCLKKNKMKVKQTFWTHTQM